MHPISRAAPGATHRRDFRHGSSDPAGASESRRAERRLRETAGENHLSPPIPFRGALS